MLATVILAGAMFTGADSPTQAPSVSHRLPDARVDEPYAYGVVTRGLVEPLTFEWSGDVPGLVAEEPWLRGTPTTSRTQPYTLELVVLDALDRELRSTYELSVRPAIVPLELLTRRLPTFVAGDRVDFEIAARGGEGKYRWDVSGTMPAGLAIEGGDGGGRCYVKGVPTEVGTIQLSVVVRDAVSVQGEVLVTGKVAPPPAPPLSIATPALPPAEFGEHYRAQFSAIGGTPPYDFSLDWDPPFDPPAWLRFDPLQAELTGTPWLLDKHSMTIVVTDATGGEARQKLTLQVEKPATYQGPTVTPTGRQVVEIGQAVEIRLRAEGAIGRTRWETTWDEDPGWASLLSDGQDLVLTGTPMTRGTYRLSMTVHDLERADERATHLEPLELGASDTATMIVQVGELAPKPKAVRVLTQRLPSAVVGRDYEVQLAIDGANGQYVVHSEGQPPELSVSRTGLIRGRIRHAREHTLAITVEAADGASSQSIELPLSVVAVDQRLRAQDPVEIEIMLGSTFAVPLPVSGGARPYEIETVAMPKWVSLTPDGLAGTATASGVHEIRVPIHDASGAGPVHALIRLSVVDQPWPGRGVTAATWLLAAAVIGVAGFLFKRERDRRVMAEKWKARVLAKIEERRRRRS